VATTGLSAIKGLAATLTSHGLAPARRRHGRHLGLQHQRRPGRRLDHRSPQPGVGVGLQPGQHPRAPLNTVDPSGLWGIRIGPIKVGSDGCAFGTNPNGSCRGSNVKNDLAILGTVAGAVAVAAFVIGTLPVSATAAATLGTVAIVAGGVSTGSTALHASIECTDGGGRGECVSDIVNVGLSAVSLGLGRAGGALARTAQLSELADPAYIYRDVFGVLSNAYGTISLMGGIC